MKPKKEARELPNNTGHNVSDIASAKISKRRKTRKRKRIRHSVGKHDYVLVYKWRTPLNSAI